MHAVILIAIMSLVTIAIRFFPFFVFGGKKETPEYISYLGRVLPYAIMAMLVVYCLKEVSFLTSPFGIPELIGVFLVVLVHKWKHNTLLSIGIGTICYMVLIQVVFV